MSTCVSYLRNRSMKTLIGLTSQSSTCLMRHMKYARKCLAPPSIRCIIHVALKVLMLTITYCAFFGAAYYVLCFALKKSNFYPPTLQSLLKLFKKNEILISVTTAQNKL